MNNRAKCKLCNTIIESFHASDYVECNCGEIAVDKGAAMKCFAKNFDNFLRVDDQGNTIVVKTIDSTKEINKKPSTLGDHAPQNRKDKINMLRETIRNIENLPPAGMTTFVNHYDLWSALAIILSILDDEDNTI